MEFGHIMTSEAGWLTVIRDGASPMVLALFKRAWLPVFIVSIMLGACTRSTVPLQNLPTPLLPTSKVVLPTDLPDHTPSTAEPAGTQAVVWVPSDKRLPLRATAGLSGDVVGYLSYDERGVELTGRQSLLGSSEWVEVGRPGGAKGWVQIWNLTQAVPKAKFCQDPRAEKIVADLRTSLERRDGALLASLVGEERGLVVRVDWWNPEVRISKADLGDIFSSPKDVDWGQHFASNTAIRGSFTQLILPMLMDALVSQTSMKCDEFETGQMTRQATWPGEYANLNYFSFYRPAPKNGNPFNWRTWAVVIEYVDGVPRLAGLVQFRSDV